MKLYYWQGPNGHRNFGDELNRVIWPKLIPEVLTDDADRLFVGIGTLLNHNIPVSSQKVIFGAGFGYGKLPEITDSWQIYCLRGPLSARMLKLDNELAIIDPAVLIRKFIDPDRTKKVWKLGYMPHWVNDSSMWENICQELNWAYISPLWEVDRVLSAIAQVECLVTEAMHGAIVAEAFRIPWIPVIDPQNRDTFPFKWYDWCKSINVEYDPVEIPDLDDRNMESICRTLKTASETTLPTLGKESLLMLRIDALEDKLIKLKEDFRKGKLNRSFNR